MKEEFTVNPDGSGKVTCAVSVSGGPQAAADLPALKDEARKQAAKIVNETQGVAAWKDVTFSADKDGKITFNGTAYFKDLTKFKIGEEMTSIRWKPTADGAIQLEFALKLDQEPAPKEPPKLTEEEITKKIADVKSVMAQQLLMMQAQGLSDVQIEWAFTLPGSVQTSANFQPVADKPNTVRLSVDGKKILALLKTLSEDDAYLRAKIVAGKDPNSPPDSDLLIEKLFGAKGPITVTFKPGDKPLFDFGAESDAAKKAMPELQKSLEAPPAK
jgi:hypothetical protein